MATTEMLCFKVYTKGDFFFSDSYRVWIYTQIWSYKRRFVGSLSAAGQMVLYKFNK